MFYKKRVTLECCLVELSKVKLTICMAQRATEPETEFPFSETESALFSETELAIL